MTHFYQWEEKETEAVQSGRTSFGGLAWRIVATG